MSFSDSESSSHGGEYKFFRQFSRDRKRLSFLWIHHFTFCFAFTFVCVENVGKANLSKISILCLEIKLEEDDYGFLFIFFFLLG